MGFKDILAKIGSRNSDFKQLVKEKRREQEANFALLSAQERFLAKEAEKKKREYLDREMDKIIKGRETKALQQNVLKAKNYWKGKHPSDINGAPNMFKNEDNLFTKGNNEFGFGRIDNNGEKKKKTPSYI